MWEIRLLELNHLRKHKLFFFFVIKMSHIFNVFTPQKDPKGSPQVNGKDSDLSKRKCSALNRMFGDSCV